MTPPWTPLRIVLFVFVLQLAAYVAAALYTRELRVNIFMLGDGDFIYFYRAAKAWLAGRSPYEDKLFVTPMASILPALVLHGLPLRTAQRVFSGISAVLMTLALWRFGGALGLTRRNRAGLVAIAALFPPTWMLLNAANLDGLMLALMLFASTSRGRLARAALLGASIAIKLYSGLLLVVLTVRDRLREAEIAAGFAVALTLPFWGYLSYMTAAMFFRGEKLLEIYNISPALLSKLALEGVAPWLWEPLYWAFWLGTLAYALARAPRQSDAEDLATFLPWMIAAPLLVFCYCAILALPTMALALRSSQQGKLASDEWRVTAAFILLGLHPEFVPKYLHVPEIVYGPLNVLTWVMGSMGTTLLLVAIAGRMRRMAREAKQARMAQAVAV